MTWTFTSGIHEQGNMKTACQSGGSRIHGEMHVDVGQVKQCFDAPGRAPWHAARLAEQQVSKRADCGVSCGMHALGRQKVAKVERGHVRRKCWTMGATAGSEERRCRGVSWPAGPASETQACQANARQSSGGQVPGSNLLPARPNREQSLLYSCCLPKQGRAASVPGRPGSQLARVVDCCRSLPIPGGVAWLSCQLAC